MRGIRSTIRRFYKQHLLPALLRRKWIQDPRTKINIGSGPIHLAGYWNIDISDRADLILDLDRDLLPFADASMDTAICISTINYLSRAQGVQLIRDVHRVLKVGGIARFASQDLRLIAGKYLSRDTVFFGETLANGQPRFAGRTLADKFNGWFYGHATSGQKTCQFFYDYETLEDAFHEAGFSHVAQKAYRESALEDVHAIDNRPEQMFFLEAIK